MVLRRIFLGNRKTPGDYLRQLFLAGFGSTVRTAQTDLPFFLRSLPPLQRAGCRGFGVVTTPGAGFGKCGEGHIRISAFNSRENVERAMERIKNSLAAKA